MPKTKVYLTITLFTLFVAGVLSNFASYHPDGLERVAEDLGFINIAYSHSSLLSDYAIPGITNVGLSKGLAGVLGSIMVFSLIYGLSKAVILSKKMFKS